MRSVAALALADAIAEAVKAAPAPEEIPEGAPIDFYDHYIELSAAKMSEADADGDTSAWARANRLVFMYSEARRRAMPPEVPDPNTFPDFVVLAERCIDLARRRHGT